MQGIVVRNISEFPMRIKGIRTEASCNATRGLVYDKSGTLQMGTCTITSNVGTFSTPIYIPPKSEVRIMADNSGSSYNNRSATLSGNLDF